MASLFNLHLLIFSLLFFFLQSSPQPDHYYRTTTVPQPPQEYIEITPPIHSDNRPPSCTLSLLRHSFGDTIGRPPVTAVYSPPSDCPPPWPLLVLRLDAASQGDQYDRIAAVWLDGVEILRTSTAEPTAAGIFWNVRKDVTRYSSLFAQPNLTLSMMLENLVNDVFTGVYHVNLTLLVYKDACNRVPTLNCRPRLGISNQSQDLDEKFGKLMLDNAAGKKIHQGNWSEKPADLIIPISSNGVEGFWFRIKNEYDLPSKMIEIPKTTRKIVLELYVSYHGDDEFWYSNPPNVYIQSNNLTTKRGNGPFREIFVKIDGKIVGTEIPFPVIFTGGINPLFWAPVVSIGAFDLPSYDLDLTPFLGLLLDGESHRFELGVLNAINFWLLDANLHIWLDNGSVEVKAEMGNDRCPEFHESSVSDFKLLDGVFNVEVERKSIVSGWVAGSNGNLTTSVSKKIKFKNSIRFYNNGTYKTIAQKVKVKTEVRVVSGNRVLVSDVRSQRKFPLTIITPTIPGLDNDTYKVNTNVSHSLMERSIEGKLSSLVINSQDSGGWMLVKDRSVLSGSAQTQQTLRYQGRFGCYSRVVDAIDGRLSMDDSTSGCSSNLYVDPLVPVSELEISNL